MVQGVNGAGVAYTTSLIQIQYNAATVDPSIPPYAVRGLHQTLEPIEASKGAVFRRALSGKLINLAPPQMQKYRSSITGGDQEPPALDGIWPGQQLLISCVAELSCPLDALPQRTPVAGSLRIADGFQFFRPLLTMMVTDFSIERDEWGSQVSWKLTSEEV